MKMIWFLPLIMMIPAWKNQQLFQKFQCHGGGFFRVTTFNWKYPWNLCLIEKKVFHPTASSSKNIDESSGQFYGGFLRWIFLETTWPKKGTQCACIYGIPRLAIGGSAFRDVLVIFRTQKVFLGEGFRIFDSRVCFFFQMGWHHHREVCLWLWGMIIWGMNVTQD